MSLTHTICLDNHWIKVVTEGRFDFIKAFEMWEAVVAVCEEHGCHNILGVSNIDEPLPSMDAYDHLSMFEAVGVTSKHRIAWVANKPELLEQLRVAENVLRNRGSLNIRVFDSIGPAQRWLKQSN